MPNFSSIWPFKEKLQRGGGGRFPSAIPICKKPGLYRVKVRMSHGVTCYSKIFLPWQQKHTVVALLSEGIKTSNLAELSTEATAINDVTCNYGSLVSMATEIYLHRFAVYGIQTLYLEHMSPATTTISGSSCCHGSLVAMATEKYFYNSVIWRSMNFMLGKHKAF